MGSNLSYATLDLNLDLVTFNDLNKNVFLEFIDLVDIWNKMGDKVT